MERAFSTAVLADDAPAVRGASRRSPGRSRLDSFIRRMQAQRSCLDAAADMIADVPGVVLEFGLGNGRTYDHLRRLLPDREIYAFDRQLGAHEACIPDVYHLFLGDVRETAPLALARLARTVALVHIDVGTAYEKENDALARFLSRFAHQFARPGAVVVSSRPLPSRMLARLRLPVDVKPNRYFMYRATR